MTCENECELGKQYDIIKEDGYIVEYKEECEICGTIYITAYGHIEILNN